MIPEDQIIWLHNDEVQGDTVNVDSWKEILDIVFLYISHVEHYLLFRFMNLYLILINVDTLLKFVKVIIEFLAWQTEQVKKQFSCMLLLSSKYYIPAQLVCLLACRDKCECQIV